MIAVSELHHQAMECADLAFAARRSGKEQEAANLFLRAFEAESAAVDAVIDGDTGEPTRSVLCRSAATLAMDCGNYREAERLVAAGLSGNPPEEIASELRSLFEEISSARRSYLSQHASDASAPIWDIFGRDEKLRVAMQIADTVENTLVSERISPGKAAQVALNVLRVLLNDTGANGSVHAQLAAKG